MKILDWFKKMLTFRLVISIIIGSVLGYMYYYFIGCNSGGCAITSSPVNSVIYGSFFGAIIGYKPRKE